MLLIAVSAMLSGILVTPFARRSKDKRFREISNPLDAAFALMNRSLKPASYVAVVSVLTLVALRIIYLLL